MWLKTVTLTILLLLACAAITKAQNSPGKAIKACPHGQPKMTSSNTPLACLTDADCGDQTYRCVQRRNMISKVCCLKTHRNGKWLHGKSRGKTRARGTTMVMK